VGCCCSEFFRVLCKGLRFFFFYEWVVVVQNSSGFCVRV
jgi:hypothetical protein